MTQTKCRTLSGDVLEISTEYWGSVVYIRKVTDAKVIGHNVIESVVTIYNKKFTDVVWSALKRELCGENAVEEKGE